MTEMDQYTPVFAIAAAAELAEMAGAMQQRAGLPVEVPVEGEVYELG